MILYYDCFSGISGDMNLAALIDVGCPEEYLRSELGKVAIGNYELAISRARRGGIEGTQVRVVTMGDHAARRLPAIRALIEESALKPKVKEISLRVFHTLAEAEARVHGIKPEEIHFHEIGAVDALVDIVGASIALDFLAPDRIVASTVELGSGVISCAHGMFPVPSPATAEILRHVPVRMGGQPFEATTPTGAAILRTVVHDFSDTLRFVPRRIGYGLGQREGTLPNVLRLYMGDGVTEETFADCEVSEAVIVECNLDDMTPEETGYLLEVLFSAPVQDVFLTPILMKKSRPAVKISVLCAPDAKEVVEELLFIHSSTFGLRSWPVTKTALRREMAVENTPYGPVSVKNGIFRGQVIKSKPEYEECRQRAEAQRVPLSRVIEALAKYDRKRTP